MLYQLFVIKIYLPKFEVMSLSCAFDACQNNTTYQQKYRIKFHFFLFYFSILLLRQFLKAKAKKKLFFFAKDALMPALKCCSVSAVFGLQKHSVTESTGLILISNPLQRVV